MNAEIPNHQTVDQKTDHNQCWYCTFWNYGLKKTPRVTSACLPLSLLASVWTPKTCDLPQENAVSQMRLSLQPLNEKRIFQEYHYFGLLLKKQNHPRASVGRCQLHSAFVRAGCYCEATSKQWTQKRFQT